MALTKSIASLVGLAILAGAATASAAAAESGEWASIEMPGGKVVYSNATDASGLVFVCTNDGQLFSMVNVDGGDVAEKLAYDSDRARKKAGTLSIEGREASREDWIYRPATKMVEPRKSEVTRKLYNAAVTGSEINIDMSYVDVGTIVPPALNDTFAEFATSCDATNGS